MRVRLLAVAALLVLVSTTAPARADFVNIYVGYLNNLTGPPIPADIPTPFDPDATTTLISSGGVATPHDGGVIRFENVSGVPVTIDPGLNVTTEFAFFMVWDPFLPFVLLPGENLVLAETVNFNFDTSDFGLGIDPIVDGSVSGIPFTFVDLARILLGHEEGFGDGGSDETTPYGLLGRVRVIPEPSTALMAACCLAPVIVIRIARHRRRRRHL